MVECLVSKLVIRRDKIRWVVEIYIQFMKFIHSLNISALMPKTSIFKIFGFDIRVIVIFIIKWTQKIILIGLCMECYSWSFLCCFIIWFCVGHFTLEMLLKIFQSILDCALDHTFFFLSWNKTDIKLLISVFIKLFEYIRYRCILLVLFFRRVDCYWVI